MKQKNVMRKIYLNFSILIFSALLGCEGNEFQANSNSKGDFVISVNTGGNDTRVSVNGLTVKWKEGDRIKLYEVDINGKFSKELLFEIDKASISEDGKSAKFTGIELSASKSYIAVYGNSQLNTSTGLVRFNSAALSGSTGYDSSLENGLFMKSDILMIKGSEMPRFKMNHLNSIIEFNVKLSSSIVLPHTLSKISISSSVDCFLSSPSLNALGKLSSESATKVISKEIEQDNMPLLSKNNGAIVAIPVLWNPAINTINDDFKITVYDTNNMETNITKPAIRLIAGTNYESEVLLTEDFVNMAVKDREALVAFYNATGGDEWADKTNWCSEKPLKEWFGVSVDNNGRVAALNLSKNRLTGTIPVTVGQLTQLEGLWLSDNQLTGKIPAGSLPATKLMSLNLSGNQFTGGIPDELGQFVHLYVLDLSDNKLTGTIPVSFAQLVNLMKFDCYGNKLSVDNIAPELKAHAYFSRWTLTPQTSDSSGGIEDFNPDEL